MQKLGVLRSKCKIRLSAQHVMENPEEILHSLEEFSKLKPKDIPRELEDYLCFVAKTGDPVYQWGTVKSLFREKLINVITDFYESCPSIEIPPCPNVEVFNYESMKTFILEKLDTFAAAPFTVQRICELLTTPRKEYNRIDKYMRALEKNILVVSTTEPGNRRSAENGDGIVNGLESEHLPETNNSNDINVEEMDDAPVWSRTTPETVAYQNTETNVNVDIHPTQPNDTEHSTFAPESRTTDSSCGSSIDSVITCRPAEEQPYVSIEPVASDGCLREESVQESDVTVTITAIPAAVQKRRDSIEPVVSSGEDSTQQAAEYINTSIKENLDTSSLSSSSNHTSVEISHQENSPNKAEPSLTQDTAIISTSVSTNKEAPESDSDGLSEPNDLTRSEPTLIQIPIISEITAGPSRQEEEDVEKALALTPHSQESADVEAEGAGKEEAEADQEVVPEISTTVTSTVEAGESKTVICETSTVTKETSVSSTDEISNDAADVKLSSSQLSQDDVDDRNYSHEVSQGDSLADCVTDTNSNRKAEESQEQKAGEATLKDIQEFASSSTSQDSMDVDIGEESCQEPPTSHG